MTDPRLTVVEDRYVNYGDHPVIFVLANPDAIPEQVAAMRAAVVAAVRDADTLHHARRLAQRLQPNGLGTVDAEYGEVAALLDLLSQPAPDPGDRP